MHVVVHGAVLLALVSAPRQGAAQQSPPPPAPPPPAEPAPEPEPAPPPDRWKMSAELSLTDQAGNRSLRLWTGGVSASHQRKDQFELEGSLKSRYGRSEEEVVARNHFGSLTFDLHPNAAVSPFLYANAERDPIKRLSVRFSGGAGAKYTPYQSKQRKGEISTSLALLYSYEQFLPAPQRPAPEGRNLARWSARVRGQRSLTRSVSLLHTSFYQPELADMADYLLRSETGIKVILTQSLALSVEYNLNRTSRPPEGVEPDDRLFKTGLIIDF